MSAEVGHETQARIKMKRKHIPQSVIQLHLSARGLRDADVFSLSDPFCVVYIKDTQTQKWREVARTETIQDNLNPKWATVIEIDFFFEEKQYVRFEVYDVDSKTTDLSAHDALGQAETTLGNIVRGHAKMLDLKSLRGQKAKGYLNILAEEVHSTKEMILLGFVGKKLDKKDLFGKSDPFLEIEHETPSGDFVLVHRTEVIKKTLNPSWRQFKLSVRQICNGDYDRTLKITCLDWNRSGRHSEIGHFTTTLKKLSTGAGKQNEYVLENSKKKAKNSGKPHGCGMIYLTTTETTIKHSFMDYINTGMEIQVTVAIDFSASNKDPELPTSLHSIRSSGPTQYEMAVKAVVDIVEDYDSDKMIPVYGFGAKRPQDPSVLDIFPLSDERENSEVNGTDGVLAAYRDKLNDIKYDRLQLYGPTNFAPIISHVAQQAAHKMDGSLYHILLILTDGEVCDMLATKRAIIGACRAPLSIIIVGIGDDDDNFTAMNELDGDNEQLSDGRNFAQRDIVQFVEFKEFQCQDASVRNIDYIQASLAKEVLYEVPTQICDFMKMRSIHPKKRPPVHT